METDVKRTPVEYSVVGLDMSLTATGFCLKQGQRLSIDTVKTTPKSAPNDLARLRLITHEMMKRIPRDVKMVCIEDYFTPSNRQQIGAAIKLVSLGTMIRMALYEAGMPFYVVAPSQIKKFATGKGVGQKSIVVREVYKRWGVDAKDDNQADATVLAYMAQAIALPDNSLPNYQQETITKIIKERPNYNVPSEICNRFGAGS